MRRNTEYSRYSRAWVYQEGPGFGKGSALYGLMMNEVQLLYLLVKWSGCGNP